MFVWLKIGSPTALSEAKTEVALRRAASEHGLYVPTGAFWGGEDIKKMADRGTLKVCVYMYVYSNTQLSALDTFFMK